MQQRNEFLKFGVLFLWIAALDRGLHAVLCVIFQQQAINGLQSGPDGRGLGQDIDTIAILFDHARDTADLTFKSGKTIERLLLILLQLSLQPLSQGTMGATGRFLYPRRVYGILSDT